MRKIFIIVLAAVLATASSFAEKVIAPASLPKAAQDFVSANFPNSVITYAESDWDEYEAVLDDGAEITFRKSGEWKDIKSYAGIPKSVLNNVISSQLTAMFDDVEIVEIEKERGGFEIKMANRMKVYFSANGKLIGQKFDD